MYNNTCACTTIHVHVQPINPLTRVTCTCECKENTMMQLHIVSCHTLLSRSSSVFNHSKSLYLLRTELPVCLNTGILVYVNIICKKKHAFIPQKHFTLWT